MSHTSDEVNRDARPLTKEETEIAYSRPAPFVNKFYMVLSGPNARIAFAEQSDPDSLPQLRSAVTMTINDLLNLKNLIEDLQGKVTLVSASVGQTDG